jgi:hypothetical protein
MVHTSAHPRSQSLPPCREGRSTIHRVTKYVGSHRVATCPLAIVAPHDPQAVIWGTAVRSPSRHDRPGRRKQLRNPRAGVRVR